MRNLLYIVFFLFQGLLSVQAQKLDTTILSDDAKQAVARLESYRQRVLKGESMSLLATQYTEDKGSVKSGGEYDGIPRGQFVPEFEAVAFKLKPGEVSEIFETTYGYHFIQLIAIRGDVLDLRHILVTTKSNTK